MHVFSGPQTQLFELLDLVFDFGISRIDERLTPYFMLPAVRCFLSDKAFDLLSQFRVQIFFSQSFHCIARSIDKEAFTFRESRLQCVEEMGRKRIIAVPITILRESICEIKMIVASCNNQIPRNMV